MKGRIYVRIQREKEEQEAKEALKGCMVLHRDAKNKKTVLLTHQYTPHHGTRWQKEKASAGQALSTIPKMRST